MSFLKNNFFDRVLSFLKKRKDSLFWWELTSIDRMGVQSLYESYHSQVMKVHQKRYVQEHSFSLEILVWGKAKKTLGHFSGDLNRQSSLEDQLSLMIELAKENMNPFWKPVQRSKKPFVSVVTADPRIEKSPEAVCHDIEGHMNQLIKPLHSKGICANTAEIYVRKSSVKTVSQTELLRERTLSDIYFEVAMERIPDHKNQEVNNFLSSVSYDKESFEDFFSRSVEETLSLGETVSPKTAKNPPVLVDEEAISSFFSAIRSQLNCANQYYKFPHLKVGDLFEYERDTFSLQLDPFLESMVDSSPFTVEGFHSQKGVLIENGRIQNQIIGNRFGQYLNKKPNAMTGNMLVSLGKKSIGDLRRWTQGVIEVVKFSSLLINEHQLTWSSEIKLAKQYFSDGTVKLIKGGVMSGNIRENFKSCFFSRESSVVNFPGTGFTQGKGYIGPKKMLILKGISVVGN